MADKDPWNIQIAARLKAAMIECNIQTAEELAERLNESSSRVRNWVNGTSRPMAIDAKRIKSVLDITMDWLYEGDPAGLPGTKYIRLTSALAGDPMPHVAEEPAGERDQSVPAAGGRQRAKAAAS